MTALETGPRATAPSLLSFASTLQCRLLVLLILTRTLLVSRLLLQMMCAANKAESLLMCWCYADAYSQLENASLQSYSRFHYLFSLSLSLIFPSIWRVCVTAIVSALGNITASAVTNIDIYKVWNSKWTKFVCLFWQMHGLPFLSAMIEQSSPNASHLWQ